LIRSCSCRPREWIGPALIGLALIGYAHTHAHACKPVWPGPVPIERPTWPDWAQLELVDERIEIECEAGRDPRRCRWRAVYVYEGMPGTAVDGQLLLPYETELAAAQLHVDGHAVLDEHGRSAFAEHRVELLHAEDAGHVEVELELELDVSTFAGDRCSWPAGFVRHMVVGREPRHATFVVHEGEILALPEAHTQLEVRAPPGWRVTVDHGPDSNTRELVTTMETRRLYRVTLENRPLAHGPFVAAGVGFGPQVRPRLRAGWELGAPPFLLYSLAIEGDAIEELMLIPAIEAALPAVWGLIPSAGIGLGAPVMLVPEPLAGVRTQASLAWPIAGLVGSVDVYPRPGKPAVRGALMLQISI
jgi:hypothetical protein